MDHTHLCWQNAIFALSGSRLTAEACNVDGLVTAVDFNGSIKLLRVAGMVTILGSRYSDWNCTCSRLSADSRRESTSCSEAEAALVAPLISKIILEIAQVAGLSSHA